MELGVPGSSSGHPWEPQFQLGLESMGAKGLLLPKRGLKRREHRGKGSECVGKQMG